jgi:hypothetical protein
MPIEPDIPQNFSLFGAFSSPKREAGNRIHEVPLQECFLGEYSCRVDRAASRDMAKVPQVSLPIITCFALL